MTKKYSLLQKQLIEAVPDKQKNTPVKDDKFSWTTDKVSNANWI